MKSPNGTVWDATGHTPAVGDLDGDGQPEIVIGNEFNLDLLAFNNDGSVKWELDNPGDNNGSNATLADLDGDGMSEVIYGRAVLINADGTLRPAGDSGPNGFEREGGFGGAPLIADLDLDGTPEIITGPTLRDSQGPCS